MSGRVGSGDDDDDDDAFLFIIGWREGRGGVDQHKAHEKKSGDQKNVITIGSFTPSLSLVRCKYMYLYRHITFITAFPLFSNSYDIYFFLFILIPRERPSNEINLFPYVCIYIHLV